MSVYDLAKRRRSIRRFKQDKIPSLLLEKCVDAARFAPSAGNLQPLEYVIVEKPELLEAVFGTLKWASYLVYWSPAGDERPTAYIAILENKDVCFSRAEVDVGMAAENIILSALAEDIASCCIANIDRERLAGILSIPANYYISLVIALGYPAEESVVEELGDSVKYWRDSRGVMHVPKKRLVEIMHWNVFQK